MKNMMIRIKKKKIILRKQQQPIRTLHLFFTFILLLHDIHKLIHMHGGSVASISAKKRAGVLVQGIFIIRELAHHQFAVQTMGRAS